MGINSPYDKTVDGNINPDKDKRRKEKKRKKNYLITTGGKYGEEINTKTLILRHHKEKQKNSHTLTL